MRRSHTILDPETLPVAGERWDWALIGLLGAMLLFMPAAFGAVEAWSELVVVVAAAALSLILAARIALDRNFRIAPSWLYLPLALFILLIALQILPLPVGVARSIAPSNIATRQEMLGTAFDSTTTATLSFYPLATAEHLRLLLVGTVVFCAVASVCRSARHIKLLLAVVFAIGCAEAALALLQILTGSGSIYWTVPVKDGVTTAGSFINYSNFSQFINLSIGAGLALLLVRVEEQRRHELVGGHWSVTLRSYWDKNAWLFAGIVICALAVLFSMSRNGAISSMIAAAVVGALLFRRGSMSWRGWLIGALPAAVLAVLLISGFDIIYDRLATLEQSDAYSMRWEMTRAAFRAWQQYPIWGTGLGTHPVVFPLFEQTLTAVVAGHADNDYAQLLEETGLIGAVCVAVFAGGIAALAATVALRSRRSVSLAMYGILFGLVAVAVHSATDFGQRLPANLSLSAALCGLVVAVSRADGRSSRKRAGRENPAQPGPRWLRYAVAIGAVGVLAIVWVWAVRDAYSAYLGERWWSAAVAIESHIRNNRNQATDEDYIDLIAAAENAFRSEPGNANYGYWLNYYRWESLGRTIDPETGQTILHPDALPIIERIADELSQVRAICPTFGPPYALEGQLRLFVLGDPRGTELIHKGVRLAPYDAATCLVAGELAAREGDLQRAVPLLERAVKLQPSYFREVVDIYVTQLERPDLAHSLAAGDHRRLYELASIMEKLPAYADRVEAIRSDAEASLRQRAAEPGATAQELVSLARIDLKRGEFHAAIDNYRRALSQEYRQVDWRLELAQALAAAEHLDEAIHEVRIALRLRPRQARATKLLEQLTSQAENARAKSGP